MNAPPGEPGCEGIGFDAKGVAVRPDERVRGLLQTEPLAALATTTDGVPYLSLVAIAAEEPSTVYFATTRATRKWANLAADPHVSLLVDNRSGMPTDFHAAAAATGIGLAAECRGPDADAGRTLLLDRHPHLAEFLASPSTAILRVQIERWYVVTRFQHVERFEPDR